MFSRLTTKSDQLHTHGYENTKTFDSITTFIFLPLIPSHELEELPTCKYMIYDFGLEGTLYFA